MSENSLGVDIIVRRILAAEFQVPVDSVRADAEIALLPGFDSVRVIRTIARLEKDLGVTVPDEDLFSARTVSDLIELIDHIVAPAATVHVSRDRVETNGGHQGLLVE